MFRTDYRDKLKDFLEILVDYELRSTKLPSKEEEDPYDGKNPRISNRFMPHQMIVIDADQQKDSKLLSLIHGLVNAVHHKARDLNHMAPHKYEERITADAIYLYEKLYKK